MTTPGIDHDDAFKWAKDFAYNDTCHPRDRQIARAYLDLHAKVALLERENADLKALHALRDRAALKEPK